MAGRSTEDLLLVDRDRRVTMGQFLAAVDQLASRLPERQFAVNLCADRYAFMVAFMAVVVRSQQNLLLPSRTSGLLQAVLAEYPQAYVLSDESAPACGALSVPVDPGAMDAGGLSELPHIPPGQSAAIVFTSGTTGASKAITKTWGNLLAGSEINRANYPLAKQRSGMVATVPPWHMYGLEWTVLVPLITNTTILAGPAFFPEDIRAGLDAVPAPRILVSTPLHLKALVTSTLDFPPVNTVMSATAPLDDALAREVERRLSATLYEIYGCSEAGSVAFRRPTLDPAWKFFSAFHPAADGASTILHAVHMTEPVTLADRLQFHGDGRFDLLGRDDDMIKLGGKRASLAELTRRLLAVDGVMDGVIFARGSSSDPDGSRLAALVVSTSKAAEEIRDTLAKSIDPVFLPRPLRVVDAIPRSDTGKTRKDELLKLLRVEQ